MRHHYDQAYIDAIDSKWIKEADTLSIAQVHAECQGEADNLRYTRVLSKELQKAIDDQQSMFGRLAADLHRELQRRLVGSGEST